MKKLILFILFCFLAFNAHAGTATGVTLVGTGFNQGIVNKILPVGDSITAGVGWDNDGDSSNDWGWRKELQDLLGIGVYDFAGSVTRPTSDATYDVDNWGTSGQVANWFLTSAGPTNGMIYELNRSMNNAGPESKVLLHVGTNDIIRQYTDDINKKTNAEIITSILAIIDVIHNFNPSIDIYCALIVPDRRSGQEVYWGAFHDDLEAALITKQATVTNLVIVDMYEAFVNDRYGDCGGDWYNNCMNPFSGDHPSATGYTVMAKQWNACIQSSSNPGCNGN